MSHHDCNQKLLVRNSKGGRMERRHGAAAIGIQATDMSNLGRVGVLHLVEAEPTSLHADVVNQLRDFIVEGHLSPGSRVPERELCERFKISRTPLREALKQLAADELLDLSQHP